MAKVSVIIPVYNAEKFLVNCIKSLLAQTLSACEFIFVNDGSVDKSLEIIADFQKTDNRIKLVNQENKGVSAARNAGIQLAQGEYIGFVDADDFIESDMYEKLYQKANEQNVEIVISNFITEQDDIIIRVPPIFEPNVKYDLGFIKSQILPFFIQKDELNTCCTKLYQTKLIQDNNINFPVGTALGEDGIFNMKAFNIATSAYFIDYYGYHYKEVDGSATRNILQKDYFKRILEVYEFKYNALIPIAISSDEIQKFKSIRFVNSVLALIQIYLKPNKSVSFNSRYQKVKEIIQNHKVQEVFAQYGSVAVKDKGRFHKFVLHCVQNKKRALLLLAIKYSNFRNKK